MLRFIPFLITAGLLFLRAAADAQTFQWNQTTGGNAYDWNNSAQWLPNTGFPDAAGAAANLNTDILGNVTVRLRKAITLGTLNFGDPDASSSYTISEATGETFALTFDSGAPATPAQLNVTNIATAGPGTNFSVPVLLNSDLAINLSTAASAPLGVTFSTTTGSLSTGTGGAAHTVTVTNGTSGFNELTFNGDLTGSGVIVDNSNAGIVVSGGVKSFSGTFVLNKGLGGSNTGSLGVTTGSIQNAAEVILNGYLNGSGATQNGGILHSGNSSATSTNPGQRLTQNRITFNGGSLEPVGQTLSGAAFGTLVQDNVSVVDFHSGFSLITMGASTATSAGTLLNVATVTRAPGAAVFVRSSTLGGATTIRIGNSADWLKGGGGADGTTVMSIIPWMIGANTNGSAQTADIFCTYTTAAGIRALTAAEFANTLTAGPQNNVAVGSAVITTGDVKVPINSLRYTSASATNIGLGKTIEIDSGGLIFSNSGTIGIPGNSTAGTVQFGPDSTPVEGVVWVNGTNTGTIGAAISGSAGLSKEGTGTLVLAGSNSYTGDTYVGGGTLQVGNGTVNSTLGLAGNVDVASGALLSLQNTGAFAPGATLRLENFGLANGRLNLTADQTVSALYFGATPLLAGTYGSSTSGAANINDAFFAGSAVLTVIPEPGVGVLLLAALPLLARRRADSNNPLNAL